MLFPMDTFITPLEASEQLCIPPGEPDLLFGYMVYCLTRLYMFLQAKASLPPTLAETLFPSQGQAWVGVQMFIRYIVNKQPCLSCRIMILGRRWLCLTPLIWFAINQDLTTLGRICYQWFCDFWPGLSLSASISHSLSYIPLSLETFSLYCKFHWK